MTDAQILVSVKTNLGITSSAYDDALGEDVTAAKAFIAREGAGSFDPSASAEDARLTVMYACYLWAQRKDPTAQMPRMLRWALNNRIFSAGEGSA